MLSALQYPHWLMVADAVLVCSDLSVLYFARQERTEPDAGAEGEEEMTGQKPVGRRGASLPPLRATLKPPLSGACLHLLIHIQVWVHFPPPRIFTSCVAVRSQADRPPRMPSFELGIIPNFKQLAYRPP